MGCEHMEPSLEVVPASVIEIDPWVAPLRPQTTAEVPSQLPDEELTVRADRRCHHSPGGTISDAQQARRPLCAGIHS